MIDLKLSEDLDVWLGENGDFPIVTGREAFNQTIALAVLETYYSEIGSLDKDGVLASLEAKAERTARDFPEYLDSVRSFRAGYTDEARTSAEVSIVYQTDEEFSFDVQ